MTFDRLLLEPHHLLLQCISGSNAYNLSIPGSDTDYKGIYILPRQELYGINYTGQVANESNDEVYYEIGQFIALLCKNNPNILELLATPAKSIVYRNPVLNIIDTDKFLSKLCKDTFAGYAQTQIKKAQGLNKKINQPMPTDRKSILDYCWIYHNAVTIPLVEWLAIHKLTQTDCGLSKISHFRDSYNVYSYYQFEQPVMFKGIVGSDDSNDVQLSSIPQGVQPLALLHFNKDAYSTHCREYREYQQWLDKRNEARFMETKKHGQDYDAKHMMHTFRLLAMGEEIARYKEVRVHRDDRDFLLKIRSGAYKFSELMEMVQEKLEIIDRLYDESDLPEQPDYAAAERILVEIREEFYSNGPSNF